MSVSSISSSSGLSPADLQSSFAKVKSDFKTLSDALQSGNLADSQNAFAALQKDLPVKAQTASAQNTNSPLTALANALQSGDLPAAQQAFTALQQVHGGHHRHHSSSTSNSAAITATATGSDGTSDEGTGSNLNAIA